jgi:hypothetical protein
MRRVMFGISAALALVACSPEAPIASKAAPADAMMGGAPMAEIAPPPPPPPSSPTDAAAIVVTSGQAGKPVAGAMLAYVYGNRLSLPVAAVRATMAAHQKACEDAGPAVCQVIGSSTNQASDDDMSGALEVRAEPKFAQAFVARLQGEAETLKGRIEQNRTAEDLTRSIIDTEAALRAKTTLRDRLQGLLRDRPGKLSDLLETEQALAQVQQEIDSAQSFLNEMRQRVATSRVSIQYDTLRGPVQGADFDVLGDAFNSFFANMAASLAAILTFIAVMLPWLLVLVPLGYGLYRGAKWLLSRRRKSPTSQPQP